MKICRVVLMCLCTLSFIVGCNQDKTTSTTTDKSDKPKVALIMKSMANPFFVNMAKGAEGHQQSQADKYDLIVNGIKNESDLAQQVALIDQMIAMRVDAIVICPADSKALVPAIARAHRAGIKVVNIDNRLDPEVLAEYKLAVPFIGPSNREGAKLVGDYVLKGLSPETKVAILEGIPTATNSIERRKGFEDAVKEAGVQLVTVQSALWDQTKAAEISSAILSQNPDIQVILAANDNMALGAASAVGLANLDQTISIAGFDNIDAVHPLLQDGRIQATVEQFGDKFAVYGIEFALEMLSGSVEMVDRQTPVELITVSQIASASEVE